MSVSPPSSPLTPKSQNPLQALLDLQIWLYVEMMDACLGIHHLKDGLAADIISECDHLLELTASNISGIPLVASILGAVSAQMIVIFKSDQIFLRGSSVGQEAVLAIVYLSLIANICAASMAFLANNFSANIRYELSTDRVKWALEQTSRSSTVQEPVDTVKLRKKYDQLIAKLCIVSTIAGVIVVYGVYLTIACIIAFCWYGTEKKLGVAKVVTIVVGTGFAFIVISIQLHNYMTSQKRKRLNEARQNDMIARLDRLAARRSQAPRFND